MMAYQPLEPRRIPVLPSSGERNGSGVSGAGMAMILGPFT